MAFTPSGVEFVAKGINRYLSDLGRADKAQQGLGKSAANIGKQFSGLGGSVLKFGALAGKAAITGVGILGAAVTGLGVASVTTAISFEDAFAGVVKTVDGLTSGIGELNTAGQELRQGFVDLSEEVPLTFEELAGIGELGGQLGIGRDALLQFTETVAALGSATNLSTEEAATGLARISNIFDIASDQMGQNIEQLGSTIVALGNNFATTERDILAFGERIAGAGKIAGLSQADIFAIGTALSSVGVEAEAGGTAVQKVLLAINNAVAGTSEGIVDYSDKIDKNVDKLTKLNAESARLEAQFPGLQAEVLAQKQAFIAAGGAAEDFGRQLGDKARQKALQLAEGIQDLQAETDILRAQHGQPVDSNLLSTFATTAGKTAEEFKQLWQEDASQAFQLFVEGLGAQGDDAINTLSDLGLEDQRLIRSFLSLAGAGDLLGETLELGNKAFEENTALATEAAQRYATTRSKIAIFRNILRATADTIGTKLLPLFNGLVDFGTRLVERFSGPLSDAIENRVVPAIERLIQIGSNLFTVFQTGGTAGLVAALGLTPQTVELIDKIVSSVTNLGQSILSFLVPGFSTLAGGGLLDTINSAIIFLNQNFEALKGAILGIGIVLAAGVFAALVSAILALLTPINLIIAAAALLGAAWVTNFGNIQGITQQVIGFILSILGTLQDVFMGQILPNLQTAFNNLTEALNNMGLTWGDVWNALLEATKIVVTGIGIALAVIVSTIVGVVNGIATALAVATSFFEDFGKAINTILTGIAEGDAIKVLVGLFDLIVTGWEAAIKTILGLVVGFAQGVIGTFQGLFETLVGGSIVPDLIARIIELFTALPEAISAALGGLADIVGNIFSSLFGGADTGQVFDTQALASGFATVLDNIQQVQELITILTTETIPLLTQAFVLAIQTYVVQLQLLMQQVMALNQLFITMTQITIPNLRVAAVEATQAMISGFTTTIAVVQQLIAVLGTLIEKFKELAKVVAEEMGKVVDAISEAVNKIKTDLIPAVKDATEAFKKLAEAAREAARAARDAGDASAEGGGPGFQSGTGGIRTVPAGVGTFPITLHPREEFAVAPPGMNLLEMLGARGPGGDIVNVSISGVTINNGMDLANFEQRVMRAVTNGLKR